MRFDQRRGSSDGGAVLLKAADKKLGLIEALAATIEDDRAAGKTVHTGKQILAQRIYAIACGYPDGNDAGRLAHDPVHALLCDRSPGDGERLASQPTISRFENSFDARSLFRMSYALAQSSVDRHYRRLHGRARRITIDLDPTDNPTHGQQQLTFFNAHYDAWCYLPMLGFITFDAEPEHHLLTAVLRPGNVSAKHGAVSILSRIITMLRKRFPTAELYVRLDGGFANSEMLDFLDSQPCLNYTVNIAKNSVLKARAKKLMKTARSMSKRSGATEHVYGETLYAAGTWQRKRRVIIKAEVVRHPGREPRDNPRFVVTNCKQSPRHVYEKKYRMRGDIENCIKELHNGLRFDRSSCSAFLANQFRLLATAAAYLLMQELRRAARWTTFARAQVETIRIGLIKIGVRVTESARRLLMELPDSFPHIDDFVKIAARLGAETS
jgi:hypothetical protein